MKTQRRRLGLKRETLKALVLDHAQLARVAGGTDFWTTTETESCGEPEWDGGGASLSGSRKC